MHSILTCLLMDLVASYLSVLWFSATNTFRSTSCSKQGISNPTFRNTQQSTCNKKSNICSSCSHFMTADKLVTASTNWFGTATN
ncbi:hypothetical protein NP493_117g01014 [Ridgeia piscesae]|uniref:Secreted protein n=1 Tax=Ridgeia piscesae TaxID=27915 RepID=A0AAD9P654_RIDPI|nr:hypothetical protein NP493_117g01014 [Ridgeia piscesae]